MAGAWAHCRSRGKRNTGAILNPCSLAFDLRRRDMIEYFVCADTRLCETAQEEGLLILNPVQP